MLRRTALIALLFTSFGAGQVLEPTAKDAPLLELGEKLATAMTERDASVLVSSVNWDTMVDRVFLGTKIDAAMEAGMRQGFTTLQSTLPNQLVASVGSEGSYVFRGITNRGGERHLLFRMTSDAGLNYHEFPVGSNSNDEPELLDIFAYSTGEYMSETMRTAVQEALGMRSIEIGGLEFANKLRESQQLLLAGKPHEAWEILSTFPDDVNQVRIVYLVRVQTTAQLGDSQEDHERYLAAIDDYAKAYPNDTALSLVAIDGYFLREQYEDCRRVLTRLEKTVGEDGYLRFLAGSTLVQEGEYDLAKKEMERALEIEPGLDDALYGMVDVANAAKDWPGVVKALVRCEKELDAEFELEDVAEFADFIKTKEYRGWKKIPAGAEA